MHQSVMHIFIYNHTLIFAHGFFVRAMCFSGTRIQSKNLALESWPPFGSGEPRLLQVAPVNEELPAILTLHLSKLRH